MAVGWVAAVVTAAAAAASISMASVLGGSGMPVEQEGKMSRSALSARPGADKRDAGGGRACCPGRCILGPNLRPKWVHTDKLGPHCLFGSGRWVAVSPFFCLREHVRTRGGRLGRPAGEALRAGA
jgi:hypothetical protein